jgi:hypothetical protein
MGQAQWDIGFDTAQESTKKNERRSAVQARRSGKGAMGED